MTGAQGTHGGLPARAAEAFVLKRLLDGGLITADSRASLVEMLALPGTRSALHAVAADSTGDMQDILAFLSRDSLMPLAPLTSFQVQKPAFDRTGAQLARRGALAFETMESDLLVAVLNPYDVELQEDVRRVAACRCMFFLVDPSDYDRGLKSLGVDPTVPATSDSAAEGVER